MGPSVALPPTLAISESSLNLTGGHTMKQLSWTIIETLASHSFTRTLPLEYQQVI